MRCHLSAVYSCIWISLIFSADSVRATTSANLLPHQSPLSGRGAVQRQSFPERARQRFLISPLNWARSSLEKVCRTLVFRLIKIPDLLQALQVSIQQSPKASAFHGAAIMTTVGLLKASLDEGLRRSFYFWTNAFPVYLHYRQVFFSRVAFFLDLCGIRARTDCTDSSIK